MATWLVQSNSSQTYEAYNSNGLVAKSKVHFGSTKAFQVVQVES